MPRRCDVSVLVRSMLLYVMCERHASKLLMFAQSRRTHAVSTRTFLHASLPPPLRRLTVRQARILCQQRLRALNRLINSQVRSSTYRDVEKFGSHVAVASPVHNELGRSFGQWRSWWLVARRQSGNCQLRSPHSRSYHGNMASRANQWRMCRCCSEGTGREEQEKIASGAALNLAVNPSTSQLSQAFSGL